MKGHVCSRHKRRWSERFIQKSIYIIYVSIFSEIQLSSPDCLILRRPVWTTLTRWSTSPNRSRPPFITMTTLMQIRAITTLSTVQSNLKTELYQRYPLLYQPHLPMTEQQPIREQGRHPKWQTVRVMRCCQVKLIWIQLDLLYGTWFKGLFTKSM